MTKVSTMDQCNSIMRNVRVLSQTRDSLDDLLKPATLADLKAMKIEIMDEVQSKLDFFKESLEIEKLVASRNPSVLNSQLGITFKETHLDVVVDSTAKTDVQY